MLQSNAAISWVDWKLPLVHVLKYVRECSLGVACLNKMHSLGLPRILQDRTVLHHQQHWSTWFPRADNAKYTTDYLCAWWELKFASEKGNHSYLERWCSRLTNGMCRDLHLEPMLFPVKWHSLLTVVNGENDLSSTFNPIQVLYNVCETEESKNLYTPKILFNTNMLLRMFGTVYTRTLK